MNNKNLSKEENVIRELKIAVSASGKETQYDEHAKNIAGQKFIIANILAKSVDAFRGMKPKDIVPYIEGEPYISRVPAEPGLTNAVREENGRRVTGFNTENQEINEGLTRFDIICYVRLPERSEEKASDGEKKPLTQIIINVEIQKNQPKKYKILNRSIFYVCRQISAQKERDFVGSHYDDIKNVYSICMNCTGFWALYFPKSLHWKKNWIYYRNTMFLWKKNSERM